jgi:phage terminase large subunit-like protein
VHFPKEAAWLADYINELTSFPQGKFDDQVDSTAQALAWISEAGREQGIITYYNELAEEQKRRHAAGLE